MPDDASDIWVTWARTIAAISQNGRAYSTDPYDRERFAQLAQVAAEIVAAHTDLRAPALVQQLDAQIGYATPKIDVRGAVVVDQRVLLVRERSDGRWCLPGGWAEVGESPAAAVAREVREECGLAVRARKLVGVYDADHTESQRAFSHAYKLVFLCEPIAGAPAAGNEIAAVAYFGFDALPPLSARRTDRRHVTDVQAHLADPTTNTAFD